jgi:peptidoglycan-N-acetylglucosamine deacetylase
VKKLSLTFDDGPNQPITDALLTVLMHYSVPATFFPIGVRKPAGFKFHSGSGFEIGNHTWSHRVLVGGSQEEMEQEISCTANYFRPPEGRYDEAMLGYLRAHDIQLVRWDYDSFDWHLRTVSGILDRLEGQIMHLGKGEEDGIVLFHDGDSRVPPTLVARDCWRTVEAVAEMIPLYRAWGFEFVPLDQMPLPGTPRRVAL